MQVSITSGNKVFFADVLLVSVQMFSEAHIAVTLLSRMTFKLDNITAVCAFEFPLLVTMCCSGHYLMFETESSCCV